MKLYTEEQVRQMLSIYMANVLLDVDGKMPTVDEILSYRTPIELPNDEDIKDKSFNKFTQSNARTCFEEGAKWMREQILGKEDKTFKQKSKWTKV
jgi:hypothetical protein